GATQVPDEPAPAEAYVWVRYAKTACYGECPVYTVEFFTDGKVVYEGKAHVEKLGRHLARLDETRSRALRQRIVAAGFFDLYNRYPAQGVEIADAPSTIVYVRFGDQEKEVRSIVEAPESLEELHAYIESIIDSLKWVPEEGAD
ncbi:MAG: hypothetical protein D6765_05020, partial [Bacteroidetes bacterium]